MPPPTHDPPLTICRYCGVVRLFQARSDAAHAHFQAAAALGSTTDARGDVLPPLSLAHVNADVSFPAVLPSANEVDAAFRRLLERLEARRMWARRRHALVDPASAAPCPLLETQRELPAITNPAYTGIVSRQLHEAVARMYHALCPGTYSDPTVPQPWNPSPAAAAVQPPPPTSSSQRIDVQGTLRVGVMCQALRGHTLVRLLGGVLTHLSQPSSPTIEVVLLSQQAWVQGDGVAASLVGLVGGRVVTLPSSLPQARRAVLAQDLHVCVLWRMQLTRSIGV